MKKISIYSIFAIIVFMIACVNKTEKKYYDTGQVKEERIYEKRNDSTKYSVIYYYSNGQIKAKGNITDSHRNGNWQEWYSDGSEKWNGEYDYGKRKIETLTAEPKIIIEDSVFRKGEQTYLKAYIEGVHPEDMAIACNNGIIKVADKKEMFDYVVIPKKQGVIKFTFFIKNQGRMIQVGADSLNVLE